MKNNYYQKHKENLRKEIREIYQNLIKMKKPRDRYQNLHVEGKEKKRQYHRERNKNISKKQK